MCLPLSDTGLPLAVERGADVGSIAHRRRAIIWRTASRRYATWPILPALEELLWSIVEREFINDLVGVRGRRSRPRRISGLTQWWGLGRRSLPKISFFRLVVAAGCPLGVATTSRKWRMLEGHPAGTRPLQTSCYNADCVSPVYILFTPQSEKNIQKQRISKTRHPSSHYLRIALRRVDKHRRQLA